MSKNIVYFLFFMALCVGALFLGIKSSDQKEKEEILFTQIDIAAVENIIGEKEAESTVAPKRRYSNPKVTTQTNTPIKRSSFTTKNMSDDEYRAFDERENKINVGLMKIAYQTLLDEDGDGKADSRLKAPHDKAVNEALEKQRVVLESVSAEAKNGLMTEKKVMLLSETIDRELYDYYYSKYGYDSKLEDFPQGQRQKMIEERMSHLPEHINRTTERIRDQLFKSIAL